MESDEQNKAHMKASCWSTSQNPKMHKLHKQKQIDDGKHNINPDGKQVYIHDNFVFPSGYRFFPHDEELIVHYLKKKIMNELLPHGKIKEVNLYKHTPQELSENYSVLGENEWYFFTSRDRKYPKGDRPNRAAGTGYWKATGADKPIKHNDVKVGFRKALVFYEGKPPKGNKTNWIMHEFRVNEPHRLKTHASDMKLDDWVLCRIYKRVNKSKYTRKEEHKQEDASKNNSPLPASVDKLENCDYEGTMDSCVEFAKQQFGPSYQWNNALDDPNFIKYSPDYFSHYGGARSSNYGINIQSSLFSDPKELYQECNIFPIDFDFNFLYK